MPAYPTVPGEYGKRAIAYLLDFLYVILLPAIATIFGLILLFNASFRLIGIALLIASVGWLLVAGLWNDVVKQGTTGQTVGKAKMSLALVNADTGQTVGIGFALLRIILIWFFNSITVGIFLLVDLLTPLFNVRKQRLVDMMLSLMVVDTSAPAEATPSTTLITPSLLLSDNDPLL
jgi:uncharacterized RDD family membrane protein YckC